MAKKKTAKPAEERPAPGRYQMTVRLDDCDETAFRIAARNEGYPNIQSWLVDQGRERANLIETAIAEGKFIRARGKVIPLSDIPSDDYAKKLFMDREGIAPPS